MCVCNNVLIICNNDNINNMYELIIIIIMW